MATIGYLDSDAFLATLKVYLNDDNRELTGAETTIVLNQMLYAYNLIEDRLITLGVDSSDVVNWKRGDEFQESQALYFCMLIFGRERSDVEFKAYVGRLDKRKELEAISNVVLTDNSTIGSEIEFKTFNLQNINDDLNFTYYESY